MKRSLLLTAAATMMLTTGSNAFAWPSFSVPDPPAISTPEVDLPKIDLPKPEVDLPKIDLPKPKIDLPKPKIDLPKPKIDLPKPKIDLPKPKIPEVKVPSLRTLGGKSSDWWKEHINKPVGAPWNRAIRDPWVRYLSRIYTTGQDRLNKAGSKEQVAATDYAGRVPSPSTGTEYKSSKVPGGKVSKSKYGDDVLAVDAPKGGTVGYELPVALEGRPVMIKMFVVVEKGSPKVGLIRDDGQVIPVTNQESKVVKSVNVPGLGVQEVREITATVKVPTDGKGYGKTDSAHDYQAVLQMGPGTKVNILGEVAQRHQ